jgi:GH25 family lysozyme M1 (1,4-beta-N-acetylmuramidase)
MKSYNMWITLLLVILAILLWMLYKDKTGETKPEITIPYFEPIPRNQYSDEGFYWENDFLRYREQEHMVGIDVSTYQGNVDWETVANSGVEFVIIRGGYRGASKGNLFVDDCFEQNYEGAKAAGLKVGVYFFSQAITEEEAVEEAIYICNLLKKKDLDLPVFYDWEYLDGRVPNPWEFSMTECAIAFCEAVEKRDFKAGVYFNQDYGYNYLDLRKLKDYTLWLADYGTTPDFPYLYHMIQYSDKGTVPGIEGKVDLNLLFP